MRIKIIIVLLSLTCLSFIDTEKIVKLKGVASYYANKFNGRRTANGEKFNVNHLTAASNKFEFGTLLKVTNLKNGLTVIVRVNDRMGNKTRLLDLSPKAAKEIGLFRQGIGEVEIEVVNPVDENEVL